jgi:hypothetical protein
MPKTYYVEALWDTEAGVFISKTNVPGLVVEAETLDEFMDIARELAPELLHANASPKRVTKKRGDSARARVQYQFTDELDLQRA